MICNSRARSLWFALLAVGFSLGQAAKHYDGTWWTSVSKSEQLGFVSGYVDCNDTELRRSADFIGSYDGFRQKVSEYYQQDPTRRAKAAGDVLLAVGSASSKTTQNSGTEVMTQGTPEVSPQPGAFNGEYWAQVGPDERLGYIEGYLWCHQHRDSRQRARLLKSPATYRDLVTNWYASDSTGDRIPTPISKVLYRLHNGTSHQENPRP